MTKDDLDRLEELEKAATAGKWRPVEDVTVDTDEAVASVVGPESDYMYLRNTHDAVFIAEFRNAAKDLIALARKGLENG